MEKTHGIIYVITNMMNGMQYIGQTMNSLEERWKGHLASSQRGAKTPLALAITEYGPDAFTREVVRNYVDSSDLNAGETEEALSRNTMAPDGYNHRVGGKGISAISAELRQRMSDNFPEAEKQRLSELYKGRRWSDLAYERGRLTNQATITMYDPNGNLQTITNIQGSFKDTNIEPGLIASAASGRRESHQGWSVLRESPEWEPAEPIGDRRFRCKTCGTDWWSMSQNHANQHARSCAVKLALIHAAHELGNLTNEDLASRIEEHVQPKAMQVRGGAPRRITPKKTWIVRSPEGVIYTVEKMNDHCNEHGLGNTKMSEVVNGKKPSHKGWTHVETILDYPAEPARTSLVTSS